MVKKEFRTVKRILVFFSVLVLLLSGCSTPEAGEIEVHDAWIRPAAQGANGAVYFAIQSSQADELTGISSDVAEAVEIHESMTSGDVMEMHPMESVPLPAGKTVTFKPGGLHIMLVGLKQDFQ